VDDAVFAVLCGDGDDVTGKSLAWWREYVDNQVNTSDVFGAYWSQIRFACHGWPLRANWPFKGPFTTPKAGAAPILFLSNQLDPVAPLASAKAMSAKHPGSVVVVQKAMGHSAIGSAPSKCVDKIVANYLDSGAVPANNTICEVDCEPWDENCHSMMANYGWFRESASLFRARTAPLGLE
jgi:pimeloyl-ACP methyl ester carboxylesterase